MNVPGLTGTWQQRTAQLYKKLGSPMGVYKGNAQQNTYLLQQLAKKNYGGATAKPKAAAAPKPSLAQQYTDPLTGQLKPAAEIPQFQNALPFYEAWNRIQHGAQLAAESQINPEAQRTFNGQYSDYMNGMVNAGGQRFGQGLAGVGSLKAGAERNRLATLQDWMGQQQQGFTDLWYNPSMEAWNTARTQANPGTAVGTVKVPTYDEYMQTYNTPAMGTGQSVSPFYGG
jgi:hypothetical protein